MAHNRAQEVELLRQLCGKSDELEHRLRIYDAAFRFYQLNYPKQALTFEGCITITEQQALVRNAPSPEHNELVEEALALVARMLQAIENPNTPGR